MNALAVRLLALPADTLAALSFFSRLPVKAPDRPFDLSKSAGAWPLAGVILALAPALLMPLAAAARLPTFIGALAALAALALLTGALHEDGLADAADGFGGGRDRQAKLAIMRDSRIGSYGALTLMVALLFKVAALAVIDVRPDHAMLALVASAAASRAMAVWHWRATPAARTDGMAATAGRPDMQAVTIGTATGALATAVLLWAFGFPALLGFLLAAAAVRLFTGLALRQIGGHTGDTIGATQQIADTLLLVGLAAH